MLMLRGSGGVGLCGDLHRLSRLVSFVWTGRSFTVRERGYLIHTWSLGMIPVLLALDFMHNGVRVS